MVTTLKKVSPAVLRSLSVVSLHKAAQIAGLGIAATLTPRLFGAEDYGRFAFVLSLSYLGQILGDFGTLDVMGRFVPGLPAAESGRLYMRTLAFKGVAGVLAGLVTAAATLALAAWMRPAWALLAGLGVALHIMAWTPFQLALGLNRVGVWMAEQSWRQWILLGLLLVLLPWLGLTGALLALVSMEALFCLLGLWWVRDYWQWPQLRWDWAYLQPYLRVGAGFFLANLATVALYRSGPALVEILTRQPAQAGYFNLALGLFLLVYVTLSQFAQSLIPTLSGFWVQGQTEQMRVWLHNFVRYSWLLAWLGTLAVWLAADWTTPLAFGLDFSPAAAALKWISLGMPPAALLWAGSAVVTVTGRGRLKFGASLAALLIFGALAAWLIPGYGATGAAIALSVAVAINAAGLTLWLPPDFSLPWPLLLASTLAGIAGLLVIMNFGP
ncbi:MAG: lipopolysaccharide biosynthesis protein [Chloroflexota bacterium]